MSEISGIRPAQVDDSEFYKEGDYLIRKRRIYFIDMVEGLMERRLGIGEVCYSGKEYEFNPTRGLLISEWDESHGNTVRRGYVQINDQTAINQIQEWKDKEEEINTKFRNNRNYYSY